MTGLVGRTVVAAVAVSSAGPLMLEGAPGLMSAGDVRALGVQTPSSTPPAVPDEGRRGGGGRRGDGRRGPDPAASYTVERVARETRVIPLGSSGHLELKTMFGDITVIAGTGRDVHVETIRRSRGRTEADAKLGLEQVAVVVDHQGDHATVSAVGPDRRPPYRVEVVYVVSAPSGTRVTASVFVNGSINVRNIKGDVNATATNGTVTISGAGPISNARTFSGNISISGADTPGSVNATSVSGNVTVDRVKARRLNLETMSGTVSAREISCLNAEIRTLNGSIDWAGTLAEGGRYEFQSHRGEIQLGLGGPVGFELRADSVTGETRADPSLPLKPSGVGRGGLRGTSGDASALVVATTFSGNVTIRRR
jgi:hypothetical protein